MNAPEGPAAPASGSTPAVPSLPAIPVICDRCRATGNAGDDFFSAIPDLLDFEPVPRRPHASGWTPEHQRAFVAALAITGSMRQAARHIGKAAYGAEQLRRAKGGRSFDAACDAAMELARDRELARLRDNLADLAAATEEANAQARGSSPSPLEEEGRGEGEEHDAPFIEGVRERIWNKLQKLTERRLREHQDDPEWREAYDRLNGPQDWEGIANGTWRPEPWRESESTEAKTNDGEADASA